MTKWGRLRKAIRTGPLEGTIASVDRLLHHHKSDAELWILKAVALKKAGRTDEALTAWRTAVNLHPQHDELVACLTGFAREQGSATDEIWALRNAVALRPELESLWTRMFTLQMATGEAAAALATTDKLLASNGEHELHLLRRATCLIRVGRNREAEGILARLLAKPTPSDAVIDVWASLLVETLERPKQAIVQLSAMAGQSSASWKVHWWLGKALAQLDDAQGAMAAFEQAVRNSPEQAKAWHELAVVQRHIGLVCDSQDSFERALELDPSNVSALRIAGYEHNYQYGDASFRRVNLALARLNQLPESSKVELHYAVAKALEDVGELDAAFEHYARAGRMQKALTPWSDSWLRRLIVTFRRELTGPVHESLRSTGYRSNKPVFIVGMPRSGTTLLEQIISSHPQAYGVGETKAAHAIVDGFKLGGTKISIKNEAQRQQKSMAERGHDYVDKIVSAAGNRAHRIVDKRPGNFVWVGLLDAAIPGSSFIHSRRHPVNTCLSAYRLFFGGEIPYSYDLRDLGRAYRIYHEMMSYWSNLIPSDRLLHIRHEDVVSDPEGQMRRLLAFIDLPWDNACGRFFENQRVVRTASALQVRRPIYHAPVDSWRSYSRHLTPLLDELGGLVAEYESELTPVASSNS